MDSLVFSDSYFSKLAMLTLIELSHAEEENYSIFIIEDKYVSKNILIQLSSCSSDKIFIISCENLRNVLLPYILSKKVFFCNEKSNLLSIISDLSVFFAGEQYDGNEVVEQQLLHNLTKRESEVLLMYLHGFSIKEISFYLRVGIKTIYAHKANAMVKIGVEKKPDLIKVYKMIEFDPWFIDNRISQHFKLCDISGIKHKTHNPIAF